MLITPHFELSQDDEFVLVRIKLPHLKADEGEFYVCDREFKFHLKPYFLRCVCVCTLRVASKR